MTRLPNRGYVDRIIKSSYTQHNNEIEFKEVDTTRPSNTYGERIGKVFKPSIKVTGYLEMDPSELRLQELGWTKEQAEILFRVPFVVLLEQGLANADGTLNLTTDFRVFIPHIKKEYQVSKFQSREPFINGQPTFVWVSGKKFSNGR
jgi:hypothetical protein